jgi:signal transduction histidine kinase
MADRRSLRLSTRVTLFFAITALLGGAALTVTTFLFARQSLLDQRETAAVDDARANARFVKNELETDPEPDSVDRAVRNDIETDPDGWVIVLIDDRVVPSSTSPGNDLNDLPNELLVSMEARISGYQRFTGADGDPYIAVGIRIEPFDASYFEAFPLDTTERTLQVLATALIVGSVLATLVATFFGWSTSRRMLRPLSRVADAAATIAAGNLDTRLEEEDDPDLNRLAGSFNDMADAVQERLEREQRFASDVSHELRSPITALTAAVEVLDTKRSDIPERTRQALDVVVSQVRRFDAMVIDLLELSRIDAGATDINLEERRPRRPVRPGVAALRLRRPPDRGPQAGEAAGDGRPRPLRADPRQPARQRHHPRRRPDPDHDRTVSGAALGADGRRGRRARCGRQRTHPHLRALRPGQRRPPSRRHRARTRAGRRARRRPRRRGLGRGPHRWRRSFRRPTAHGGAVNLPQRTAIVLAVIVAPLLVQACSLPPDDRVTRLDADELGPELVNPTTTTTTTVPPTTVPTTTDPSASAPETTTTTTTIAATFTEVQRVYYTLGSSDDLQPIPLLLPFDVSYASIRNELVSPRPEVRAARLATAVPTGLVSGFRFDATTVTLDDLARCRHVRGAPRVAPPKGDRAARAHLHVVRPGRHRRNRLRQLRDRRRADQRVRTANRWVERGRPTTDVRRLRSAVG